MDRVRLGAVAGIGGALLFTCGWVIGGLLQPMSYSWTHQEISDLGALTAHHAWVWNLADSLTGVLLLVFAVGIYPLLRKSRAGRTGTALIGVVGLGSVLDGLLREDCPLSTSDACQRLRDEPGLSWHHQAHDIESVLVFLAILAAPFAMARAVSGIQQLSRLRIYTLATGGFQVAVAVAYAVLYGETGGGTTQRLLALSFMAWIAALSTSVLISRKRTPGRVDRS